VITLDSGNTITRADAFIAVNPETFMEHFYEMGPVENHRLFGQIRYAVMQRPDEKTGQMRKCLWHGPFAPPAAVPLPAGAVWVQDQDKEGAWCAASAQAVAEAQRATVVP
jgi:hypothetical protein